MRAVTESHEGFRYEEAFSRTIGILTPAERDTLRAARIGIAGLGGAGSNYVIALARLGVGELVIADPDEYELANMNRQAGAMMSTLGRQKVEVMAELVADINPEAKVHQLAARISTQTIGPFLDHATIVIDAIDGRDLPAHEVLHEGARQRGMYSIMGGCPAGFGASITVFGPGSVSYPECFGIEPGDDDGTLTRKVFTGLAPIPYAEEYLPDRFQFSNFDKTEINFSSVSPTLYLCTALAVTEVLCILLGRRQPTLAPDFVQVDLCLNRMNIGVSPSYRQRDA